MKTYLFALILTVSSPVLLRAAAPVRSGIVVLDATQFLGELPDGDTAMNGRQGGGGGRRGAAAAAASPAPSFTFENFAINLLAPTSFGAKANLPDAGTWYLYVRS